MDIKELKKTVREINEQIVRLMNEDSPLYVHDIRGFGAECFVPGLIKLKPMYSVSYQNKYFSGFHVQLEDCYLEILEQLPLNQEDLYELKRTSSTKVSITLVPVFEI